MVTCTSQLISSSLFDIFPLVPLSDVNSDVTYSGQKKTFNSYLSLPTAIGRKQKKHFSTEEISTMPTWVTTMKHHHDPQWNMFTWLIHTTTLSNLQQIAYKIVEIHFNNNCENPLL